MRLVGGGAEAALAVGLVVLDSSPRTTRRGCRPRTRACASRCGRGTSGRGEMTTAQPAKSTSASSSARSVSTSRSLVGSSSSSRLQPRFSSFARCTRLRSPPESDPDLALLVAPVEVEPRAVGARVDRPLPERHLVLAAGDLLPDRLVGSRAPRATDRRSRSAPSRRSAACRRPAAPAR